MDADPLNATSVSAKSPREALGRVISVQGSQASVRLPAAPYDVAGARATVGKFLGIRTGRSLLIGVVTDVSETVAQHEAMANLDLVGEITDNESSAPRFQRGVTEYPAIGDPVVIIAAPELALVFKNSSASVVDVGHIAQEPTIGAYIDINDLVTKHFAVLGTTGVGKSSGVALLLQEILRTRSELRLFVLDAHNEYGHCFGDRAQLVNPRNLKLPFWLFNFEEIVDVLFGGRPGSDDEVYILSEAIPAVKASYEQQRTSTIIKKTDPLISRYSVDAPVPYRLTDLIALLDERMGKLENRSSRMTYHKLITRIETVRNDPQYAFMFDNANVGGDTAAEILAQLFRLPANGKPMTVMQLAGFPAEVVDAVVSVLCRLAFDFGLWSDGAAPLLFVCEEAHRYISADRNVGFGPTRRSISRIAKEGRKYGVFLGLVSQRPAELDATILSQCSTLFAMRMTNDRDQAILRSAVSDGAAHLLAFLPSLGTSEALAFGEGVALPTRLKFRQLPSHLIPKSEATGTALGARGIEINQEFVASVLARWRGIASNQKISQDESLLLHARIERDVAPLQWTSATDGRPSKILKSPVTTKT